MNEWHINLYNYATYLSYILLFVTMTGLIYINPNYLNTLNLLIKVFISLFLIVKFNPFTKQETINKFDKEIAFSAGVYVLLSTSIITPLINYLNKYKKKNIDKIINQ